MGKIFKVQLENKFTQVPNTTAKSVEKAISLQALGLLVNIMSYAETWELHKTELYKRYAKNKRTSVKNAWDELVEADYIMECRIRDGKKWDYNYFVRLQPFSELEKEEIKKQVKAQTPDENSIFWDVDFGHPKMDSPKSTANKELKKVKRTKEIKTGKYVSSESVKLFFENYQPNKQEQKELIELIAIHGEELCLEAIQRTFTKGKKDNVINYIKGILNNWAKLGLKSILEVLAHEKTYWEAKKTKRSTQKKSGKQSYNMNQSRPLPAAIQAAQNEIQKGSLETAAGLDDMTDEERMADIKATLGFLRSTEKQILN